MGFFFLFIFKISMICTFCICLLLCDLISMIFGSNRIERWIREKVEAIVLIILQIYFIFEPKTLHHFFSYGPLFLVKRMKEKKRKLNWSIGDCKIDFIIADSWPSLTFFLGLSSSSCLSTMLFDYRQSSQIGSRLVCFTLRMEFLIVCLSTLLL